MHLIIYPDGRTARHGDLGDTDASIVVNHRSDLDRARLSLHTDDVLALCSDFLPNVGLFTLWVGRRTVTDAEGLRNTPASLLGAQWGLPARVLAGPVVVTCSASSASAMEVDARWGYVESLTEDIVRAMHGLSVSAAITDPVWPYAIRLIAGFLDGAPRATAPELTGVEAVAFWMREPRVLSDLT